jgi:hypothetical protein
MTLIALNIPSLCHGDLDPVARFRYSHLMSEAPELHTCPDCDDPMAFTFMDTAGVGAWKQGDGFNTTPDTAHYVCFPCGKTWKQRLGGPLTPDIIGEIAFFSCRKNGCGRTLAVTRESASPTDVELACADGHAYVVVTTDDGGLTLGDRSP